MREIATTKFSGIGSKYEFQCSLPQWRTETILREHLQSLGVEIEYGTEVKSIEDDEAGLKVSLDVDGRMETLATPYVLGAGGAHSVTRHSMQEHLGGETYDGRFIVADAKIRLACLSETGRIIVGPTGFVLLSPLPDNRWLIFVNRDETDVQTERPAAQELGALLNARVGADVGLHDLEWISYFKMHKRVAERISDGRRFLLGDADPYRARSVARGSMQHSWMQLILPGSSPSSSAAQLGHCCSTATRPNAAWPTIMCSKCPTRFMTL